MNQTILEKQRTIRCKTPIVLLSIVSLVFTALSCITYFVNYHWEYNDGNSYYEMEVGFPSVFELISLLLSVAPYILFVLYILKFHKEFKATILVPITLGLIAFNYLFYYIESAIFGYDIYFRDLIFDIVIIVAFGLATFGALKGFNKKVFLIIAMVVGLLVEVLSILNIFNAIEWYLEDGLYLYLFTWTIGVLGTIAFYIAILLFALKNRIPAIISTLPEKEKKNAEKMNPEQALRVLKDKLDFGMITEEEYQAQRAEIISKL